MVNKTRELMGKLQKRGTFMYPLYIGLIGGHEVLEEKIGETKRTGTKARKTKYQ